MHLPLNLALNEVGAYLVLSPWHKWTGGEDGLSLFFKSYGPINFRNNTFRFYFCLVSLLLVVYLVLRLVRSPYGNLLKAIKENEVGSVSRVRHRLQKHNLHYL
jgi:branched-chain amino acid transport system permease protein